ncbi:unnamed protein product [Mytilus coruscus]|uniref:MRC n=1 Tax=Mytilus coruscus TaxID=42192 RepID=A0A6J8A3P6_MYTCO|nr:unnamed protein product [Mytilus coruscus]
MKSSILTITVLLGMLFVPAIEMKRKRCHKRPTVVECPEPLPRTCAHWNITVTTMERFVGNTGILSCSAGYSLIGNDSITCLESGVWSPISAICVSNDIGEDYVRSFSGSTYILVKTTKGYEQAKESCISMCGTLLEINNQEENRFIVSAIEEVDLNFPYIGLESKNGIYYEWQSGNTTNSTMFENWSSIQPDETEVGSCVFISSNDYKWFDSGKSICTNNRPFICESRFD